MYLFQPRALSKSSRFFINIYIPLCIYFNWSQPPWHSSWNRFTFHYVSISTSAIWNLITHITTFTFHYVSISTWSQPPWHSSWNRIYIPLCIYFNSPSCSAMPSQYSIYIPLCIYFNPTDNSPPTPAMWIYIPLCIYFNLPRLTAISTWMSFTFHYVSISTWSDREFHSLHNEFTFHYVSISTNQISNIILQRLYLHSTMYLFQPQIFRSLISIRIIVALLSTKQTSIIFILTCSGNIWIITDKIRIVDLPVILQYYVPTVKA